jgi:hypothetical protein
MSGMLFLSFSSHKKRGDGLFVCLFAILLEELRVARKPQLNKLLESIAFLMDIFQ